MRRLPTYVCLVVELNDTDDKRRYFKSMEPRSALEMEMLRGLELELTDRFSQLLKEKMNLSGALAEVNLMHRVPILLAEG